MDEHLWFLIRLVLDIFVRLIANYFVPAGNVVAVVFLPIFFHVQNIFKFESWAYARPSVARNVWHICIYI